jgi:hypothetical protein
MVPKGCYLLGRFATLRQAVLEEFEANWSVSGSNWLTAEAGVVKNVISMDEHLNKSRSLLVRDRRYAIRHPFAADAEFLDMETGSSAAGVTSDLSMGGCFVCTSKPLAVGLRVKLTLRRKEQSVEALAAVRIVKPRVGMGLEFLDMEPRHQFTLEQWLEQLRRDR